MLFMTFSYNNNNNNQTVVIDGAEEYRVEPGSGRNIVDQTNIFHVDGDRRSELKS